MKRSIFIGYDPREAEAFAVFRASIQRHLTQPIPIHGIILERVLGDGLYSRRTEMRDGRLWDTISEAPMATEFAISRFLTPHLAGGGQALFMDCDMLARSNLVRLFDLCGPEKAVWCVKHRHNPANDVKMDNQAQTRYARKNWSSMMVFTEHPANQALTLDLINTVPGRDLHRFCWLDSDLIGELDPRWNFLVGHTDPAIEPDIVHFTEGGPWMKGYESVDFADEWIKERNRWVA